MIKNYDFPQIFRAVIGQLFPPTSQDHQQHQHNLLDTINFKCHNHRNPTFLSQRTSAFPMGVRSHKKTLQRREKMIKTASNASQNVDLSKSDRLSAGNCPPLFSNFLKKKHQTTRLVQSSQGDEDKQNNLLDLAGLTQQSYDQPKTTVKKRNKYRVRTSMNSDDEKNTKLQITYKNLIEKYAEIDKIIGSSASPIGSKVNLEKNSKGIHEKTEFCNFNKNGPFNVDQIVDEDSPQNMRKRTNNKKKTVNFILGSEQSIDEKSYVNSSRRATKIGIPFVQKSTKFNKKCSEQDQNQQLLSSSSEYTARTVVSIKFSSNRSVKSKKSIQSDSEIQEQDQKTEYSNARKRSERLRTHTIKQINGSNQNAIQPKKYKSVTKFSTTSIDVRPTHVKLPPRNINKMQTRKKLGTAKSIKNVNTIQRNIKKKIVRAHKVSILAKKSEPFLLADSLRNLQGNLLKMSATFQQLVYRKNTRGLLKTLKSNTEGDAFNQLNNFHKFLHQNDIQQNDQQAKRSFPKPTILSSQINNRSNYRSNSFQNQNLMIDMGLTLVRKANRLMQKKV